jgi:hypothetical protein
LYRGENGTFNSFWDNEVEKYYIEHFGETAVNYAKNIVLHGEARIDIPVTGLPDSGPKINHTLIAKFDGLVFLSGEYETILET